MTEAGEVYRWHRYVPSACSDEDVQALRALLAEYTEAEIGRRLNVPNLEGASMPRSEELATPIRTPVDALIGLFHECLYVSQAELPDDALGLLDRLGLIARDSELPGMIYATVAILRIAGELTVCDWDRAPDGSDDPLPPDLVYPPIFDNTRRYLASLPSTPCEAMLEIGTGSGIAAIVGARHARRVWATDITARAVHFASLSCRLAGLENVTVLEGDLYNPVEGLTFDRIAIHPPWIPASQSTFVFGDGGQDGETIIRGSIEGLPRFLRPGGRFYATLLGSDREAEKFEQRVRRWLGAAGDQFDIALAELACDSPERFLAQNLARGSICERDVPLWTELWKATHTEAIVYGHLIVQRHKGEREPATARGPSWIPN
jgi:SAM-dependent methyltransferase